MIKRVVIVRRTCHEFANKLWNDMSIYAYAYAVRAKVWNLAVWETGPLAALHTVVAYMLGRRGPLVQYTLLPPTIPLQGKFLNQSTVYFFGWLFRNPEGLRVYRQKLLARFGPSRRERAHLRKIMAHKLDGRRLLGVQLRLQPFPLFPEGTFLVSPERVRKIVDEYLERHSLRPDDVGLVLICDGPLEDQFTDFAAQVTLVADRDGFLLLSQCTVIIGTNTSFSNLAAWFGDVPHIVTTGDAIDWSYYDGHKRFFKNKYATLAFGMPSTAYN